MMADETFKEQIARHIEAGTCYLCDQPVKLGDPIHGLFRAHWDCYDKDMRATNRIIDSADPATVLKLVRDFLR